MMKGAKKTAMEGGETVQKSDERAFSFPAYGLTVMASNHAEAEEKLAIILASDK